MTTTLTDRFLAKVDRTGDCWLWTGWVAPNGYGQFAIDRHPRPAHRAAYELFVGPIPDGLHLDHLCRNRRCVNPAHLEPVTQQENNRRVGAAITRCPRGHEYTPENTMLGKRGQGKKCRTCANARRRKAVSA